MGKAGSRLAGIGLIVGMMMASSVVLDSTSAGARPAPGTIDCTSLTGTIKFNPPLTNSAESVTMRGRVVLLNSDCQMTSAVRSHIVPHGSTVRSTVKATVTAQISCGDITGGIFPAPITWSTIWSTPPRTSRTVATFSKLVGSMLSPGTLTLDFPGHGGTVSATGSYIGDDNGASSSLSLEAGSATLSTQCAGSGVKKLKITAGAFFSG
jgi:hypothetical protein